MKRRSVPIPARRAAIAILTVGFFFASGFYWQGCGGSTYTPPPAPPPMPEPAPIEYEGGTVAQRPVEPPQYDSTFTSWTEIDHQESQDAQNSEPTHDPIGAVVDAAGSVIDWWEDDPLNGPAEEAFDGLNTAVETAGTGSEVMNNVVIATGCHPVGNTVLGVSAGTVTTPAGGAVAGGLVASTCHYND